MKILVIRFSSIGDIILTSPIVRCIKLQKEAEVHFLVKKEFREILNESPFIDQIHTYHNNLFELIKELKQHQFDLVIDLHNNLRSKIICFSLVKPYFSVKKENMKRLILINFGYNYLKKNVVEKYFDTITNLSVKNDDKGLDYFIKNTTKVEFNLNQKYIAWSLGARYHQKKLNIDQILSTIKSIGVPIVFLGGKSERKMGDMLIKKSYQSNRYNFCGKITLDQSAMIVKNANLLLTNDSALMHIGCAFNTPLISFWGCTKPTLGFAPYNNKSLTIELISNVTKYPCSKHGSYCKVSEAGCIKQIDTKLIEETIIKMI